MKFQKGDSAPLIKPAYDCRPPTPGVCYHIYEVRGEPIYCFLFANGARGTFTYTETKKFFNYQKRRNFNKVALYNFTGTAAVDADWQAGEFDVCFEGQPIKTKDIDVEQKRLITLEERKGAEKILLVSDANNKRLGLLVIWNAGRRVWQLYDGDYEGNLYTCLKRLSK